MTSHQRQQTLPQHVQDQYRTATTVQDRFVFYHDYLKLLVPFTLKVKALVDLSTGTRKEIHLIDRSTNKIFISGLIHRPSDAKAEETAADEAYTRVYNAENWPSFRFFVASDMITFFRGNMESGGVGGGGDVLSDDGCRADSLVFDEGGGVDG